MEQQAKQKTCEYEPPKILAHTEHAKFVSGPVTAKVWLNKAEVAGKIVVFPSVTLNRSVTFPHGRQIEHYEFLNPDFKDLIVALNNAYHYMRNEYAKQGDQNRS